MKNKTYHIIKTQRHRMLSVNEQGGRRIRNYPKDFCIFKPCSFKLLLISANVFKLWRRRRGRISSGNNTVAQKKRKAEKESRHGGFVTAHVSLSLCGRRDVGLPHLVLFLEAVTLGALHLGDVLQQVGYADGGVQLGRLVGHVHLLSLP